MCLAKNVTPYHRAVALGEICREAAKLWHNTDFSKKDFPHLCLPIAMELFKAFHEKGFLFREVYQIGSSILFNYFLHRIESTKGLGKNSLLFVLFEQHPLEFLKLFKKKDDSKHTLNLYSFFFLKAEDLSELCLSSDERHLINFLYKIQGLSHPSLKGFKDLFQDRSKFSQRLQEEYNILKATLKEDAQQVKKDPVLALKQVFTCVPEDKKVPLIKSIAKLSFWLLSLHWVSGKDNSFEKYGLFIYLGIDSLPKSLKEISDQKVEALTIKKGICITGHLLISLSKAHKIYLATALHLLWELSADITEYVVPEEVITQNRFLSYFTAKPYKPKKK